MNLNIHIILEDLSDYRPQSSIRADFVTTDLRYPVLYKEGMSVGTDVLYIIDAERLETLPRPRSSSVPNFVSIGTPSIHALHRSGNYVWVDESVDVVELLNKIAAIFTRYNEWYESLQAALNDGAPLRRLGELSSPIFRNPINVSDAFYETLFSIIDRSEYDIPDYYIVHQDSTPWPAVETDMLSTMVAGAQTPDLNPDVVISSPHNEDTTDPAKILNNRWPFILVSIPGYWDYDELCYNLYLKNRYIGRLSVDEIGKRLTPRDFTLIKVFGDLLCLGMKSEVETNLTVSVGLGSLFMDVLDGQPYDRFDLFKGVDALGWHKGDPYLCVILDPISTQYGIRTLHSIGEKLCSTVPNMVYLVIEHRILCIADVRENERCPESLLDTMAVCLDAGSYHLRIAGSNVFYDIANLRAYRTQAEGILDLADEHDDDARILPFSRHSFAYLASRYGGDSVPDAIYPAGILRLRRYDKEHGTDFAHTLFVYFECNMNSTKAASVLYVHRNTLLARLDKIKGITGSDYTEDTESRVLAFLALTLIERRKRESQSSKKD